MKTNIFKKRVFFVLFTLCCFSYAGAQKTINVSTAGTLGTLLTSTELNTVTDLTITGNINTADFTTMRDNMPLLAKLNISGATITTPANYIPASAFSTGFEDKMGIGKTTLTEVILPNNLKGIQNDAFRGCTGITSLTIPASVTDLSPSFISYANSLAFIDVASGNATYKSVDGVLFSIDGKTLVKYPGGKDAIFYQTPAGVETIGENAFAGITILQSIIVGEGVETLKGTAFLNAKDIRSIILPSTLTFVGGSSLGGCEKAVQLICLAVNPPFLESQGDVNGTFWDSSFKGLGVPAESVAEYLKKIDVGAGWGNYFIEKAQGNVVAYKTVTMVDGIAEIPYAIKDTQIPITAEPTKAGEGSFAGWTADPTVIFLNDKVTATYFVMPASDVTITANYREQFDITVTGGTSSLVAAVEGAAVNIYASAAQPGQRFYRWIGEGVTFANDKKANTSFTMLNKDVTITAEFKDAYTVTMVDGFAFPSFAVEGETVEIIADEPSIGERFTEWLCEDEITFVEKTNKETSFVMPAKDLTISARFGSTGIDDIKNDDMVVYPNPAEDFIQVTGLSENVSFSIVNSLGQLVKSSSAYNGETINVSGLPSGIYFFCASEKTKRFIKK